MSDTCVGPRVEGVVQVVREGSRTTNPSKPLSFSVSPSTSSWPGSSKRFKSQTVLVLGRDGSIQAPLDTEYRLEEAPFDPRGNGSHRVSSLFCRGVQEGGRKEGSVEGNEEKMDGPGQLPHRPNGTGRVDVRFRLCGGYVCFHAQSQPTASPHPSLLVVTPTHSTPSAGSRQLPSS